MKVVAMLERSEGNAQAGTAWTETAVFDEDQKIRDVLNWAVSQGGSMLQATRRGRLMLDVTDMRTGS